MDAFIIISTLVTFMIWSFFYRESVWSNLAEYTILAVFAGQTTIAAWTAIQSRALTPLTSDLTLIIPLILGATLLARMVRKYTWVSSYGMALIYGSGTGLILAGQLQSNIINQLNPLFSAFSTNDYSQWLSVVIVVVVLVYFTYTFTGTTQKVTSNVGKVGRWLFVFACGAYLATGTQNRIGRVPSILINVLVLQPTTESYIAIGVTVAAITADAVYRRYKKLQEEELKATV